MGQKVNPDRLAPGHQPDLGLPLVADNDYAKLLHED
jgi:hypothetical protein